MFVWVGLIARQQFREVGAHRKLKQHTILLAKDRRSSLMLRRGRAFLASGTPRPGDNRFSLRSRTENSSGRRVSVLRMGSLVCIRASSKARQVPTAVIMAGPVHNWMHWLIEYLPMFYLAEISDEVWARAPFLLREGVASRPNHIESLKRVYSGPVPLELADHTVVAVQNPVILRSPNSPGPPTFGFLSSDQTKSFDFDLMARFREKLISSISPSTAVSGGARLFLVRPNHVGRSYNQDELVRESSNFGFVPVCPEEMGLDDLWTRLHSAEAVIGPQGAAWANTIVCRYGTVGVQWSAHHPRGGHFENIARVTQMTITTLICDGDFDGDYRLEPLKLASALTELGLERRNAL